MYSASPLSPRELFWSDTHSAVLAAGSQWRVHHSSAAPADGCLGHSQLPATADETAAASTYKPWTSTCFRLSWGEGHTEPCAVLPLVWSFRGPQHGTYPATGPPASLAAYRIVRSDRIVTSDTRHQVLQSRCGVFSLWTAFGNFNTFMTVTSCIWTGPVA